MPSAHRTHPRNAPSIARGSHVQGFTASTSPLQLAALNARTSDALDRRGGLAVGLPLESSEDGFHFGDFALLGFNDGFGQFLSFLFPHCCVSAHRDRRRMMRDLECVRTTPGYRTRRPQRIHPHRPVAANRRFHRPPATKSRRHTARTADRSRNGAEDRSRPR